jgi:hypothetical protein
MSEHNIDSRTAPSVSLQNTETTGLARILAEHQTIAEHIAEHGVCARVRLWASDWVAEEVLAL